MKERFDWMNGCREKTMLRAEMRRRRREIPPAVRAAYSCALCARLLVEVSASPVAVYLATADEIDLSDFIRGALARGQTLVAPRWNGEAYDLAVLDRSADSLQLGPMNVLEPREARLVAPADVAVWLVPGLAFTADGGRLGYGGGWYDRLLDEASPTARKLGLAAPFQIVKELPLESHDKRLDGIVTMKTLEEIRQEIDDLDSQLAPLLARRIRIADDVAAAKRAEGRPIGDPAREAAVLDALSAHVPPDCAAAVRRLYGAIFAETKARQR